MEKKTEKMLNEFKSPGSIYRGAPFWAWNGKLEPEELRRQIRIMYQMGLGGFFMHSRVGLDTSYLSNEWFECINACTDEAEKLKMLAYLYDEDRWPSGAAGGLVTKNPRYRMRHLCMKIFENIKLVKWSNNVIAAFAVNFEGRKIKDYKKIKKNEKLSRNTTIIVFSVEVQKNSDWYNGYAYLDTMNEQAVKEFIKITHQRYKKYSGKYFGKVIPGIFTDEPNYGSHYFHYIWPAQPEANIVISWTEKLPEVFKKRYGYDILNHLPEIYYDVENQKISKVRYHYFDCITHLFVNAFAKQIYDWCEKNNILFTGHVLSEETLISQTNVVGSALRFYEYMQAPGMDLLTEHRREFNTAKQVSSVANQFGRKWRLTETYGCTGWDFPFSGHKALGDWQTALGINLRCQHLSWYTMLGEAKRDYPASIFYQSPWWQIYSKVENYFARIYAMLTKGKEIRDLLVIHPIESMWAIFRMPELDSEKKLTERDKDIIEYDRMFQQLCDVFLSNHIDFDYGDEEILSRWAKATKEDGSPVFKVNQARYKVIVVPPLYTIRSSTLNLLKKFNQAGGTVLFVEKMPEYVDGLSTEGNIFDGFEKVNSFEEAVKKLEGKAKRVSITDENGKEIKEILYLLKEDKDSYYLFLCNTSMEWKNLADRHTLSRDRVIEFNNVTVSGIPDWQYPAIELDPDSGKCYAVETIKKENGYAIKTSFPAIGSRLFIVPKKQLHLKVETRENLKEIQRIKIEKDTWDILLSEPNVFVLDKATYKIGETAWQEKKEILKLDRELRKQLGIPLRGGQMVQPWAREKNKKLKTTPVTLKYVFSIEKIPSGRMCLAIEKPSLYNIDINGYSLSADMKSGWWVDKSLELLEFDPCILKKGENEILIETGYNAEHPGFEIIYLLGNFGVKMVDGTPVITEKVEKLSIGDWTQQGLLFYSGNVTYLHDIHVNIEQNQKIFVNIPEYYGAAVRILVDGKQAGIIAWPPNTIDITEFVADGQDHTLGIEILGHRKNSHGPLHFYQKYPLWTGPYQFIAEGN
ncbi:MAG TPA: glycosyl hydrolase, partial [bacterium]|nr:glycosyl hydrolase [bacterium]HPO51306.1 glycosyl hydrolase [bacterium]